MNIKLMQTDPVEIQDPTTDDHVDENSFMPGFISFCQDAQLNQVETDQLYATIDADLRDMRISSHDSLHDSLRDDIPLQLAKMYQR